MEVRQRINTVGSGGSGWDRTEDKTGVEGGVEGGKEGEFSSDMLVSYIPNVCAFKFFHTHRKK